MWIERRSRRPRPATRPSGPSGCGTTAWRQYESLSEHHLDRDPWADPGFTRDPIIEEVDVVVLGGGFAGMLAASTSPKRGITSFRIVEKAGDFGGTWYWNRYPGCMCDVESYIYLPLLEETGYMPTEKYASAAEIFGYCQLLGRHFGLYDARPVPDRGRRRSTGTTTRAAGTSRPSAATGSAPGSSSPPAA